MAEHAPRQLKLLEIEPFAGGPARLPRARRARAAPLSTLPLPLEAPMRRPVEPVTTFEAARRSAIERSRELLRARLEQRPAASEKRAAPAPTEEPPREPDLYDSPAESWSGGDESTTLAFFFSKPVSSATRQQTLDHIAERLGPDAIQRGSRVELRDGADRLVLRTETRSVLAELSGPGARSRWGSLVREAAQEQGLVELE